MSKWRGVVHRKPKVGEKAQGSRRPHLIIHSATYLRPSVPQQGGATGRVPAKTKTKTSLPMRGCGLEVH